jgi:hypothetical protein
MVCEYLTKIPLGAPVQLKTREDDPELGDDPQRNNKSLPSCPVKTDCSLICALCFSAAWANTTNFPPKKDRVTGKEIDAGFDPISMFRPINPFKICAYSSALVGQNGNKTRVTAGSNPSDPQVRRSRYLSTLSFREEANTFSPPALLR